jgi:hypothetical protein
MVPQSEDSCSMSISMVYRGSAVRNYGQSIQTTVPAMLICRVQNTMSPSSVPFQNRLRSERVKLEQS